MSQFFINPTFQSKERFDLGKLLEFTNEGYDVLNSTFLEELKSLPEKGVYIVSGEDGKPALISHKIYGSTQYWWVLMFYNGILKSDDIVSNMAISYPSLNRLEDLFFSLRARDVATKK